MRLNRTAVQVAGKPDARNLGDYFSREYESNNGLYNVTTLWNPAARPSRPRSPSATSHPSRATSRRRRSFPLADGKLDLTLDPLQMRIFLTPRNQLAQAGAHWFDLQRQWWREAKPVTEPFPKPDDKFVRPLNDNWAWKAMDDKQDPDSAPGFDDSSWPRVDLGAWNTDPAKKDVHHAELRRNFTVPAEWSGGTVRLWIATAGFPRLRRRGPHFPRWKKAAGLQRRKRDQRKRSRRRADAGLNPPRSPWEVRGKGQLNGLTGDAWIIYAPKPVATRRPRGTMDHLP